jgi:hypothetical protein
MHSHLAYLAATLLHYRAKSLSMTALQAVLRLVRCLSTQAAIRDTLGISGLQRRNAPVHICCASALKATLEVNNAEREMAKANINPTWALKAGLVLLWLFQRIPSPSSRYGRERRHKLVETLR